MFHIPHMTHTERQNRENNKTAVFLLSLYLIPIYIPHTYTAT